MRGAMEDKLVKRMSTKRGLVNPVAVTMRRRSTMQMEVIGGGFLNELSEEQEEALRLVRNAVKVGVSRHPQKKEKEKNVGD